MVAGAAVRPSTWASYTGQVISWEEAMQSDRVVAPHAIGFDAVPPTQPDAGGNYPIPVPGVTKFA